MGEGRSEKFWGIDTDRTSSNPYTKFRKQIKSWQSREEGADAETEKADRYAESA